MGFREKPDRKIVAPREKPFVAPPVKEPKREEVPPAPPVEPREPEKVPA